MKLHLHFAFWWINYALADFVTPKADIESLELFPNHMSYEDSVLAVAENRVITEDGSFGTAWINTTDYCTPLYHFREIGYHAVVTHLSYNYLLALAELAEEALTQGLHGDFIFLLFKFGHEGRELPTGIRRASPMIYDMAKSLDTQTTSKQKRLPLLEFLRKSTNLPIIRTVYDLVSLERKTRVMRLYRSLARKMGKAVFRFDEAYSYFLFVRILGVPVRSVCAVGTLTDENFESYDDILAPKIQACEDSHELKFFGQSCYVKLILPRVSELRTGVCS